MSKSKPEMNFDQQNKEFQAKACKKKSKGECKGFSEEGKFWGSKSDCKCFDERKKEVDLSHHFFSTGNESLFVYIRGETLFEGR